MLLRITNNKSGYSIYDFPRKWVGKRFSVNFAGNIVHLKQVDSPKKRKGLHTVVRSASNFLQVQTANDSPPSGHYKFLVDERDGLVEAYGDFVREFKNGQKFEYRKRGFIERVLFWILGKVR